MQVLVGSNKDKIGNIVVNWYAYQLQLTVSDILDNPFSIIGWSDGNKIVAASLLMGYNGHVVEAHFYGPGKFNRQVISDTFKFVFYGLKCKTLITKVKIDNNVKKIVPRLGFKYRAVIPNYYGESSKDAAILYTIQYDSAKKWIR